MIEVDGDEMFFLIVNENPAFAWNDEEIKKKLLKNINRGSESVSKNAGDGDDYDKKLKVLCVHINIMKKKQTTSLAYLCCRQTCLKIKIALVT